MMKVFAYRKCSTCMKALKWLEAHNVEFEDEQLKKKTQLTRIKRMVHNERTSTQKVLQYQWYDIQTDEPERQIKRNDRRRPVKTPGNRRNARKTPISNRR